MVGADCQMWEQRGPQISCICRGENTMVGADCQMWEQRGPQISVGEH